MRRSVADAYRSPARGSSHFTLYSKGAIAMTKTTLRKTFIALALVSASLGTEALAHGGYGGMMGGGMMGGGMMGPGMIGGGMMGPGMIGGGMGGGMGHGMLSQLNPSPEQWKQLSAVHQNSAKKQWDLMGSMREETFKLRNLLASEKRDRDAIIAQFKKIQDIRLQMFQVRLEEHDELNSVLTSEQKAQLRRFAPSWGHHTE
jgi:Spy/CpxP family protein refolding chaperone